MKNADKNDRVQSVSQNEIAKEIAEQTNLPLETITRIVYLEQKLTMISLKEGKRVVKKNYLTLIPIIRGKKNFHSPLTNKDYAVKESKRIKVIVGAGFKAFVNPTKKMPQKMCRFVDNCSKGEEE